MQRPRVAKQGGVNPDPVQGKESKTGAKALCVPDWGILSEMPFPVSALDRSASYPARGRLAFPGTQPHWPEGMPVSVLCPQPSLNHPYEFLVPDPCLLPPHSTEFSTKLYHANEIKFKSNQNPYEICPCKFGRQFQTRVARHVERRYNH